VFGLGFYGFVRISLHWLWFLWACSRIFRIDLLISSELIFRGLPFDLLMFRLVFTFRDWPLFLQFSLDFYELVWMFWVWSWLICIGLDFWLLPLISLVLIFKVWPWFLAWSSLLQFDLCFFTRVSISKDCSGFLYVDLLTLTAWSWFLGSWFLWFGLDLYIFIS